MGKVIYILSLIVTLNLWIISKTNQTPVLLALSQIIALWTIISLCWIFIISGRFKWSEEWFGGLDKAYKFHHFLGKAGMIMALIHPFFLAIRSNSWIVYFLPSTNLAYSLGVVSLYILIILLVMTLVMRLPYHVWLFSHQFMGLVLISGSAHLLLIGSDIGRFGLLKIWIIIWLVAAFFSYFYRKWGNKFLEKKYLFEVTEFRINGDIRELWMKPLEDGFKFEGGQFAFFEFLEKEFEGEVHPFSLASGADDARGIRIIVKALGDFSKKLNGIKAGDKVKVSRAWGNLGIHFREKRNAIIVAGGIGVTPFLGMLEDEVKRPKERKIKMFYSIKNKEENFGDGELRDLKKRLKNFDYKLWISEEKGWLTAGDLIKEVNDYKNYNYLICGPQKMMITLRNQLLSLGVRQYRIFFEDFNFK